MNNHSKTMNGGCYKMNGNCHKMNGSNQENGHPEMRKSYMDAVCRGKKLIWNKKQKDIPMEKFKATVRNKYGINIDTYSDLHKWSIQNIDKFWAEIFKHFEIIYSEPYCQVLPPYEEIVDIEWFRGLKFNYAENILRYRDDRVALICLDEDGRKKNITYAKVYEEVIRYATALRKHGLKVGDKVACYMSNREEPVFAMLACASIGAVWAGLVPFYGPKAVASALRVMNPKVLFTIDSFNESKTECNILANLASIVNGIPSIEKVIILATKEKTLKADISGIHCRTHVTLHHIQERTMNCVFGHIGPITTLEITDNSSHGIPPGAAGKTRQPALISGINEAWPAHDGSTYHLLWTIFDRYNKEIFSLNKNTPRRKRNCSTPENQPLVCKSCFLDDFLESGTPENNNGITDLKFEQLPFNHPVSINFTSGTTGIPKGVVHSAGAILALLRDFGLHWSCTRNDVILSTHSCGWTLWNMSISTLALGCTVVLFFGNPFLSPGASLWDIIAKYKVTLTSIVTSVVDKMEKLNIVPDPSCDLSNFRLMAPVGSPVKLHNFDFLKQKVKQDMFVGSLYGTTEIISCISGFDLNSPAHSGEIQSVTLGLDLRIFDDSGNSVIGQPGEVVVCSPVPNFPLYLLNDENGEKMRATYLSKFPGVWSLNDEGFIDPETNGLVILGRSDEIFNPQEERFGPNDIYFAIQDMEEIVDSLCVCQNSSKGCHRVVLFVKLSPTSRFTEDLVQKISKKIQQELTEYHIPAVILETKEIPLNANGKRMERLISKILDTNVIPESNNSRNPQCLESYRNIPELQGY